MKHAFPLRHIACHYLDAYCASRKLGWPMTDEQITKARVHFHQLLDSFEVRTMMDEGHWQPVSSAEGTMNPICAVKKLVSQFASAYFGFDEVREVSSRDLDDMRDYFRDLLGEEFFGEIVD